MPVLTATLDEAREHLRVIRQTMERSTQYSTLSGLSGVLIGFVGILGTVLTERLIGQNFHAHQPVRVLYPQLGAVWLAALLLAVGIEFAWNKRRAARIGKSVASPLGGHIIVAALPAGVAAAVLTAFFYKQGMLFDIWGVWMLCYGLAICAVGLFSVRQVSLLGGAFVLAGAITLLLPVHYHLFMMGLTFGGFHILYGLWTARRYGW